MRERNAHRPDVLRRQITVEAARLMLEEGVKQYYDAKRLAVRRLFSRRWQREIRHRQRHLPANAEVKGLLLDLVRMTGGEDHERLLFDMRRVALETMRALEPFRPRLIGSVRSGHIRPGSDIDLHVFVDDEETFLNHLEGHGYVYEVRKVSICKSGRYLEFTHVYLDLAYPVELTVCRPEEIRVRTRSSTDGRPIVRVRAEALERLMCEEQPELWREWRGQAGHERMP